jgi:hypothetical protein
MGPALLHRHRRLSATFALLGMAFYAVLIPWHTVSQTAMLLAQVELGTSANPICHGDSTPAGEPSKDSSPSKQTHCPICSGFAALQFALAGSAMALLVQPESGSALLDGTGDHLTDALVHAPQSRGPPLLPT